MAAMIDGVNQLLSYSCFGIVIVVCALMAARGLGLFFRAFTSQPWFREDTRDE